MLSPIDPGPNWHAISIRIFIGEIATYPANFRRRHYSSRVCAIAELESFLKAISNYYHNGYRESC